MNTWQIIGIIVFSTMIYLSFQTGRSRKREQVWRKQTFPEAECSLIKEGCRYDIALSDGRKAYVRQACIRCMIESERPSESAA